MASNKYQYLKKAQAHHLPVPPLLHLPDDVLQRDQQHSTVTTFVQQHPADRYIVRSAVANEDGDDYSYAGYFSSSESVTVGDLAATITTIYQQNVAQASKLASSPAVGLIIMPFITSQVGGVLFAPWLYFTHHALVEFAPTPQQAVAGQSVQHGLLAITSQHAHTGGCSTLPTAVTESLSASVQLLQSLFNFPLDIEWVYDGVTCYILQIRPITIAPSALEVKVLPADSRYSYTSLSETLGKLSPISFALLNHLYTHATQYCSAMGIAGGKSFLHRAATGNILVDTRQYELWHSNTHWYSPLQRGLQAKKLYQQLADESKTFKTTPRFSITTCQTAFDSWQTANTLEHLLRYSRAPYAEPYEYELAVQPNLDNYPTSSVSQQWKVHFLRTLIPLREHVHITPLALWQTDLSSITDTNTVGHSLHNRYQTELEQSLYTYVPAVSLPNDACQPHDAVRDHNSFCIPIPERWVGPLPRHKIIITSHIPQHWIAELPHIAGIKLVSLSALSHAAITLREYAIPITKITQADFKALQNQLATSD